MPSGIEPSSAPATRDALQLADTHPGGVHDIELARASARAARTVANVADLTAGRTMAVTYGPGETVVGVTVAHPSSEEVKVEAHLIVTASLLSLKTAGTTSAELSATLRDAEHNRHAQAALLALADDVRAAIRQTVNPLLGAAAITVDVFIDDVQ